MQFYQSAQQLKERLIEMRRYIHENAELGDNLPKTTAFVMETLKKLGLQPKEISKSAVVATIEGGKPGKTIMLRADMDALPMGEINDLAYSSKTEFAHTCGHDLHTAMLLGAAELLMGVKDELCGNVKLMFQPAEEVFSGSAAMLKAGLMENPKVDAAFDMHVMSELPLGTITRRTGFVTASCDGFEIKVLGKSCHGAQPQNGIDPINAAAHIHLSLQALIARETPPSEIAVCTIGKFTAGSASNILPDEALMQGTLRCYNKELRAKLNKRFKEVVENTAAAFGAGVELGVLSEVPSIYADPGLMEACVGYIDALDIGLKYNDDYLVTASDDFARVSELVPSTFFAIGAMPDDESLFYPNHNPHVIFNEGSLPIGAAIHAQCAYHWLKDNA